MRSRDLWWTILPALGAGLGAVASGRFGAGVAVASGLAVALGVLGLSRWLSPWLALLVVVPAMWLPLATVTSASFVVAQQVVGGYDVSLFRSALLGAGMSWVLVVLALGRVRPGLLSAVRARRLFLWCGLPVLVVGLSFRYQVHAAFVSPEEGAAMVSLDLVDGDGAVGRDLAITEGLGQQVARPWLASRCFGRSLRGLRLYQVVVESLDRALVSMIGIVLLPPAWAALFALALVCGVPEVGAAGIDVVAHGALLLAAVAIVSGRSWRAAAAGAVGGAAVLWQLPSGLPVIVGAALALTLGHRREGFAFTMGAGAVVVFGLARLGWVTLGHGTPVSLDRELGTALIVACVWCVVRLSASGGLSFPTISFLGVTTLVGTAAAAADAVPPMLLLFALAASAAKGVQVVAFAVALVAGVVVSPVSIAAPYPRILHELSGRSQVALDDRSRLVVPNPITEARLGVLLPVTQARELGPLLTNLGHLPPETRVLDLSDTPILHILSGKRLLTRYPRLRRAHSFRAQREVTAALRDHPPDVVVMSPGKSESVLELAGGHLVAAEVLRRYRPAASVGGFLLLDRAGRSGAELVEPSLELGSQPRLLARRLAEPERPVAITVVPTSNVDRISLAEETRLGLTALVFEIHAPQGGSASLRWHVGGTRGGVARVGFSLATEQDPVSYLIPVASLPSWVWAEQVSDVELRLEGARLVRAQGRDDGLDRER